MDETLFDGIPTSVLEDANISFCAIPSQEEIRHAIKHMNPASLTGNDNFTCYFYLACWDIIKVDQCAFVLDFFQRSYLPRGISDTTLILLPKKLNANQITDFRPISLGNFSGKIVSKILAMRLTRILPSLVDEVHAGFVKEHSILTHIVLAREILRDLNRKSTGGNVVFKLDMTKAHNRL